MSNQLSYRRRPDLATFYGGALDEAQAATIPLTKHL